MKPQRLMTVVALFALSSTVLAQKTDEPKRIVIGDGIELHYVEKGKGEPIIFVHGSIGDYSSWARQLQDFSKAGYRAIAYSRRYNYPNNNKLPADRSRAEASDLAQFIRKLNIGKVHLVGFSAGGYAALVATLDNPDVVRTLTLAEPPLISWLANLPGNARPKGLAMLRELAGKRVDPVKAALDAGNDLAAVRGWVDSFAGEGSFDELPKSVRDARVRNARELKALLSVRYPPVDRGRVRELRVPTLILSAEKTTATSSLTDPELERLLPAKSSKRVVIPDARHIMWIDKPELCRNAVLNFIRDRS